MPLKTHLDEQPSLNLTPMIDIVFLLIIFFMVGTKFSELERSMGLRVPEVTDHGALTAAPERKMINVYRDGRIELDQQIVSLDELQDRLTSARKQYADLGVLVRGDGMGYYQSVAAVLNACTQAGIRDLNLAVQLKPPDR
ncbi:MAG: biopolymer transporter ExbD [Patescibacteria group bacterium]|nr:biopolymer transporter ExbD [Patescibacteria group bacterium]